jgi:DNA ligase 1
MKKFNTLYKRAATGTPQEWTISVDGNQYWTEAGRVGGVITKSEPTICFGKNAGRANSTTDEEQALAEATSKHQKKLDLGYVDSLDKIDDESPFFKPMLAHKFLDKKHKIKWGKQRVFVQPKLDGHRCITTPKNTITATTRNGIEYASIPHILEALKPIFSADEMLCLDGEAYNHDLHNDFNEISSIIRKTQLTLEDIFKSAELAQYHIYDCPSIGDLDQTANFFDRYTAMVKVVAPVAAVHSCIHIVPIEEVFSEEEVMQKHDQYLAMGYEGIIVRINGPYENKRSNYLLKYKVFDDAEFTVDDILPGKGLKANMAAKIKTHTKEGREFFSNIKAPHNKLREILQNTTKHIGRRCTIRYFGVSPNDKIPRFPYVVDIDRWDI